MLVPNTNTKARRVYNFRAIGDRAKNEKSEIADRAPLRRLSSHWQFMR